MKQLHSLWESLSIRLPMLGVEARKAVFKRLEEITDIAALSKEERMKYDESIRIYRDNLVVREYAVQEGHREGYEKGLKEGMEEGIEKGIEEGKIHLKDIGMDAAQIASVTGLPIEKVQTL